MSDLMTAGSGLQQTVVNMGPQHPSTHGVLRLIVTLEGEVIADVKPDIGYLHRSVEKIGENRLYQQFIPYTDRCDYVGGSGNTQAYVLAVEKLAGIEVPERAQFIRVMLAELNRLTSHLVWLSAFGVDMGATTVFLYGMREREPIMDLMEMVTGARLTYSWFRIGGCPLDLPAGFDARCREALRHLPGRLDEMDVLFTGNPVLQVRCQQVGILPPELGVALGASGPTLRGSGVPYDVRRAIPYEIYPKLDFAVAAQPTCDVMGRYLVRIEEMRQSIRIVEQCLDLIPPGPVMTKLPRAFKPPAGEAFAQVESPRGHFGVYLASDGSNRPRRVRLRAPSFANLQAVPYISKGWKLADLVAIVGSLDIVLGEVDR